MPANKSALRCSCKSSRRYLAGSTPMHIFPRHRDSPREDCHVARAIPRHCTSRATWLRPISACAGDAMPARTAMRLPRLFGAWPSPCRIQAILPQGEPKLFLSFPAPSPGARSQPGLRDFFSLTRAHARAAKKIKIWTRRLLVEETGSAEAGVQCLLGEGREPRIGVEEILGAPAGHRIDLRSQLHRLGHRGPRCVEIALER